MKTNSTPCAKCGKAIQTGREVELQAVNGRFVSVENSKGDVWVFGADCAKKVLRLNLTPAEVVGA